MSSPRDEQLEPTMIYGAAGLDETIDRRPPALIEGSVPRLSDEIHSLLRSRLRSAAMLLAAGFLAFLINRLTHIDGLSSRLHWFVFGCHITITVATTLVGCVLCLKRSYSLSQLRLMELVVFGGSGIFFSAVSYSALIDSAAHGYVATVAPMWMVLVFTYALFIPNTWQRSAWGIGVTTVVAIAILLFVRLTTDGLDQLLSDSSYLKQGILDNALVLGLSALISVWGVFTINSLRREAFEARQYGQYRLTRRLGSGGMGEVYLAEHRLLKRPSAIKLIRPGIDTEPGAIERFEAEVQATATLSHWNTVEIFDYGRTDDGVFYYVMEYLPGLDLQQIVDRCGPMPIPRAVHFLQQISAALDEAHQIGLIHRDIKPANVVAARRGGQCDVAKLVDFGLAQQTRISGNGRRPQAIVGSPLCMAPEQAYAPQMVDGRSDLYAVGATGYFLLTGRYPFVGDKPMKLIEAHRTEPLSPPSVHAEVPEDLEKIIMRCLEKDPDCRFQTAAELLHALCLCKASGVWTAERAAAWWRDHRDVVGSHSDPDSQCGEAEIVPEL